MSKLFVYYTNSGNGEVLSKRVCELGADLRRVQPKKDLPKSFLGKMLSGGFQASVKYKAKLDNFDFDISQYDEIIIGSPIWNGRISSPINSVLGALDLTEKKVTFILYSASGKADKSVQRINKEYPSARVIVLKEPKKYGDELEKIDI